MEIILRQNGDKSTFKNTHSTIHPDRSSSLIRPGPLLGVCVLSLIERVAIGECHHVRDIRFVELINIQHDMSTEAVRPVTEVF